MADRAESPEGVAFDLLRIIATAENKSFQHGSNDSEVADREWILDTYAECLRAAKGSRGVKKPMFGSSF
jgi:hypothetical protein